ncbi:diacylglycerol/lipid kinase family protein [Methylobrevis pamukkalensis]|uniref:Putative lipid kinase BmrU n=1 Tax=Methylobrevis pamukkalensis TaxID=1439726 RepID=A0A1E3H1Q2_9HYPH|nr:diacylglycerol kinase family protein [Methylobrevis pamukkalensis]ODN70259.1 putative lipid kinase BmrU [Methylobrevis pamukkalensis]
MPDRADATTADRAMHDVSRTPPSLRVRAVVNGMAGTARGTEQDSFCTRLVEAFVAHGHVADCAVVAPEAVEAAIAAAADDPAVDVLVACGGDGTVSLAARHAVRGGKILGVLPGGTMNLFARSLGLSTDLDEAVLQLAAGTPAAVDIAVIEGDGLGTAGLGGRPFVHQFSVGLKARMVKLRKAIVYRSRLGKIVATLRAAAAALSRPPNFEVEIATPEGTERRRASAVAVSNNPFGDRHLPYADRLDGGQLGLYVAAPLSARGALRLGLDLLLGRWRANPDLQSRTATSIRLAFRGGHVRRCVIDGELVDLPPVVTLRIHPGALTVLTPGPIAEIPAGAPAG